MMSTNNFSEIAKSRSDIYGLVAGIFGQEFDGYQIKEMKDKGILDLLIEAGADIVLDFFDRKLEEVQEDLACEYAALFIGPGKHIAPYESIYVPDSTGRVGQFWGECTVDMKNWVEHYGLKISERHDSIPDHISIELEFMQKIVEQEHMAWESNNEKTAERCLAVEKEFFNKHIINWIPEFCEKVITSANIDFYREIARFTKEFITQEKKLMNGVA
jgi:TorA maturation chaperone TorD